ncbi:hypothetical protein NECAME_16582 [Necator americanus]|uniref:Uncharacterized protein n=1 Tax=Necator americanus TaxID=51031 RepID=W2TXY1_NECAM|nr:hypothetical protein NECAME_16582 [Necator americanus]ETN85901.1 hypothetical protein NECAME_16582 [Necator americanus]
MTSLTTLLNSTGVLKERDQQEWMDFIIETSGAADAFDEAKVTKRKEEAKTDVKKIRGPDGQPIILTKENVTKLYGKYEASKVNLFEQLQNSFAPEQLLAMNRTGYAVLSPSQRVLVYGENSPFNNSIALEAMRNVTDYDAHRTVRDTVRHVAAGRLRYESRGGVLYYVIKYVSNARIQSDLYYLALMFPKKGKGNSEKIVVSRHSDTTRSTTTAFTLQCGYPKTRRAQLARSGPYSRR